MGFFTVARQLLPSIGIASLSVRHIANVRELVVVSSSSAHMIVKSKPNIRVSQGEVIPTEFSSDVVVLVVGGVVAAVAAAVLVFCLVFSCLVCVVCCSLCVDVADAFFL